LWKEAGIATKAPNHQSAQKIFCAILCFSVFVAKKGSVPLRQFIPGFLFGAFALI
jgi:hypothetical protein